MAESDKKSPIVVIRDKMNEQIECMINPDTPKDDALRCHNYILGMLDYAKEISIISQDQYDHFRTKADQVVNSIM